MVLADGEHDGLAEFVADGVAQAVSKERLAEQAIGGVGEEFLFEILLEKAFLFAIAVTIALVIGDGVAFIGQQFLEGSACRSRARLCDCRSEVVAIGSSRIGVIERIPRRAESGWPGSALLLNARASMQKTSYSCFSVLLKARD
jgi:hypothetical protein